MCDDGRSRVRLSCAARPSAAASAERLEVERFAFHLTKFGLLIFRENLGRLGQLFFVNRLHFREPIPPRGNVRDFEEKS